MTLRKLHLYGPLAEKFGSVHEVFAQTLPDALRIVECNHTGFLREVRAGKWHCALGKKFNKNAVDLGAHPHHLYTPRETGDFHLVPALEGAKGRGFKTVFMIVVGGALLATGIGGALAAAALPGTGASLGLGMGLGMSTGILGLSYGTVALLGAGFLLGGINMLMSPTPRTENGTADRKPTAFSFDGPANVSDEGGPIPIVIGEIITGSITIASAVTAAVVGTGTGTGDKLSGVVGPTTGTGGSTGDGTGSGGPDVGGGGGVHWEGIGDTITTALN